MKLIASCLCAAFVAAAFGEELLMPDASPDRVETPLNVPFKRLGTIRPRAASEIKASNWTVGCEGLDRDFDDFTKFRHVIEPLGIKTETLHIIDLVFGKAFSQAIEAKVTAEQEALAAKNILDRRKYEAQQLVATAEGKAKAMQIEAEALQNNPSILRLRALEKWNGVLPRVMGGEGMQLLVGDDAAGQ